MFEARNPRCNSILRMRPIRFSLWMERTLIRSICLNAAESQGGGGKVAYDPPMSAAGEQASAQPTSAENGFIVSNPFPFTETASGNKDHSAFQFKPSMDHHAVTDLEINDITKGALHSPHVHSTLASGSVNFLDSLVRTSGRGRIRLRREAGDRHIADEPVLVACICSPAKLHGFLNLVGAPRCSDARRCHSRGWHTQRAPAAMASLAQSSCSVL
jgi:hypothetical protein